MTHADCPKQTRPRTHDNIGEIWAGLWNIPMMISYYWDSSERSALTPRLPHLASSAKFRGAAMAHKTAMLERHVDVARLFGAYTWDTLPTRYLAAYTPPDKLKGMDAVAQERAGIPWPTLSYPITTGTVG